MFFRIFPSFPSGKNSKTYVALQFLVASAFWVTSAVWFFYLTERAGLSIGEAMFLSVFPWMVCAALELPTGSWADRFGRKKIFALGSSLEFLAWLPYAFWFEGFFPFLASAALLWFWMALSSGALEGIIHDELSGRGEESSFERLHSVGYAWLFFGKAVFSLLSGYLYVIHAQLPYAVAAVFAGLAVLLSFSLREPEQAVSEERNDLGQLKKAFSHLLKNPRVLTFLLLIAALSSLGNVYYFTYQPLLESEGFSKERIGLVFFWLSLVSAFSSSIWGYFWRMKAGTSLVVISVAVFLSSAGFVLFGGSYLAIPIALCALSGGLIMTVGNSFVLENAPNTQKSTLLSIFSLLVTTGYSSFVMLAGWGMETVGLERTYQISAISAFILLFLAVALGSRPGFFTPPPVE